MEFLLVKRQPYPNHDAELIVADGACARLLRLVLLIGVLSRVSMGP